MEEKGLKFLIRGHVYAERSSKAIPSFYELHIYDSIDKEFKYLSSIASENALLFCQECNSPIVDSEETLMSLLKKNMTILINTVTSKVEVINENAIVAA